MANDFSETVMIRCSEKDKELWNSASIADGFGSEDRPNLAAFARRHLTQVARKVLRREATEE